MHWWSRLPPPRRRALIVTLAAAVLAVGAGLIAMTGESPPPVVAERAGTPIAVASSVIDPGTPVAAIATAELEPTEVGLPTLSSLKDLRDRFGDPPSARRGRFRIPRIGVDAPLGIRAVPASLQLPSPAGPADVVLYDFGAAGDYWGGMPGGGNAVFSGHVDYSYRLPYAEANYHGRAVFWDLRVLAPGDEINILIDGVTFTYAVAWKRTLPASGEVWGEILQRDVGADAITLVTCDGEFNPATQEYNSRTVVRAVRA
jgi:sortase (surface protein transpeptidase)